MDLAFLKEKKGPLPVWAWAAIATIILYVGYRWYKNRSTSTATPAAAVTPATTDTSTPSDLSGAGGLSVPDATPTTTIGRGNSFQFGGGNRPSGPDQGNPAPSPDPTVVPPSTTIPSIPITPAVSPSSTSGGVTSQTPGTPTGTTQVVGSSGGEASIIAATPQKAPVTAKSIPTSEAITAKAIVAAGPTKTKVQSKGGHGAV